MPPDGSFSKVRISSLVIVRSRFQVKKCRSILQSKGFRCTTSAMFYYRISPWRFFAIFIVTCFWEMRYVQLISHQSHLCEAMDMPCRIGNGDECRMKYYELNSTDCRDLVFNDVPRATERSLGRVRMESYHYNLKSYKQTGFNLSFTNISWNHLKFRFRQEGNKMKNTCREFHKSSNSTIQSLFYDCLWSNENYEGKIFSFEYEASNDELVSYKKYSFRVPFAKNIDEWTDLANWEIFILVEMVKNTFGSTAFILHWQPLPKRFFINNYNIRVYSNESGQVEVIYFTNITCNHMDECKYYYNKWYGNVQFGIQPVCKNNSECFISKTAIFLLGGENAKPLLIAIVSVAVIIPAIIYVVFILRHYLIKKSKKWICPVPKVLVIFSPSLSFHVNVVLAFVEYLKMYCNVEPLIDELHIFESKSRDPFKWCNEAFKSADIIMVVASPYHKHLRLADSVYQNTDLLLLRLLQQRLALKEDKTRFLLLMLPYCSEKDIPSEAINLRRFYFPEDLNKMLRFIHKDGLLPDCLSPEIRGGKENYKLLGTKLSNAIAETQANLKKNKADFDRMVEEIKIEKDDWEPALLTCGVKEEKVQLNEFKPRKKKRMAEFAEGAFSEFPGRIDDLNLLGEEGESLMESQKTLGESDIVNLDVLDL